MTRLYGLTLAAVGTALAVSASTEPDAVTRWLIACAGLALAGVGVTHLGAKR